jgi:hypothetical protein
MKEVDLDTETSCILNISEAMKKYHINNSYCNGFDQRVASSVKKVQHATIEEVVFSVDPTSEPKTGWIAIT